MRINQLFALAFQSSANGLANNFDSLYFSISIAPEFITHLFANGWPCSVSGQRADVHEDFSPAMGGCDETETPIIVPASECA
jgi:hypothetical protein